MWLRWSARNYPVEAGRQRPAYRRAAIPRYRARQFSSGETTEVTQPAVSSWPRRELTLRGVIIGIVITVVFTAANVFFGLKAGLTFATSIPAAVISMAILRALKNSTVQENNIVQTVASAAGLTGSQSLAIGARLSY